MGRILAHCPGCGETMEGAWGHPTYGKNSVFIHCSICNLHFKLQCFTNVKTGKNVKNPAEWPFYVETSEEYGTNS